MQSDIIMKINQNPLEKKFLREHSFWYKYLNRSSNYYPSFIKEMKETYKLTTSNKIEHLISDINMFKTFLDVLK